MEYGLLLHYEYSVLIYFANTLSLGNVDSIPLMEGEGRTLRVLGFNHAQRAMFLQTLNRLVIDMPLEPVCSLSEYLERIVYVLMLTCYYIA